MEMTEANQIVDSIAGDNYSQYRDDADSLRQLNEIGGSHFQLRSLWASWVSQEQHESYCETRDAERME